MASASRPRTAVPVLPSSFVSRPDLVAALDRGEDRALTLVCAPAGYGKTLLVADWVRRQDVACAWVALEEEDDDPQRLWTAILSALAACPAVPADSRLRELVVPRTAVGVDFLTELIEALDAVPDRVRLVLDDAHHLRGRRTLHGLRLLLRLRPRTTQLVLTSRSDPALPVARLRLEEQLCEVRHRAARFLDRGHRDAGRSLRTAPEHRTGGSAARPHGGLGRRDPARAAAAGRSRRTRALPRGVLR